MTTNPVVRKAMNALAMNAVGRDKQDAASVEMWIGLFNNFLNWSLKKHGDPAKARKNGETILKNIEDSLDSDGGREQLKKMGWTMQKLRDALEKGLREMFVQNSVRTTNPIVRKALNSVAANAQFKVGDIVEAMRPQVHKLGVKGTVTRVKPDTIIVKWHDDGFEAQYGIEGNFKSATPKQVVAPEQKLREELMRSGYGRDRDSAIGWLTAHRRGLVTKYGRDTYEKVWSETASNSRTGNARPYKNAKDANGKEIKVGSLVRPKTFRPGTEEVVKSIEGDKVWYTSTYGNVWEYAKNLIVANARARNGKWVVLYRDGGKEKIDAPSHAEAKKIADDKSKKSGRGYISVIVDDGVDYGINAATNATEWEKVYQIKGMPVKLVWRGEPFNDLKATVEGGNRTYVPVARITASNPVSQTEAEKLCAAKWRQIKATANAVKTTNAVVAKALNAQLHDYEVPVVKRGVKSTVTIRRVADEETAKKLAADPLTGTEVDVSRSVSVLNAEAVCNERYLVQTLEGDRWETKKTTPSRMDADSYMRVYQRSYSLSDVRILRASDGAEIARG